MAIITAISSSYGSENFPFNQTATAEKPVYATGSMFDAQIMGSDCAVFDGSNDNLEREGANDAVATMPKSSSAYSILNYIHYSDNSSPSNTTWGFGPSAFLIQWFTSADGLNVDASTFGPIAVSGVLTGSGIASVFVDDGTNGKYFINNQTSSLGGTFSSDVSRIRLGSRGNSSTALFLSGAISEILFVSRAIDNVEVEAYKRHILNNYLDPENISGMVARWKADTNVSQSTTVYSWTDSIGGIVASQSTETNKPDFTRFRTTSDGPILNGKSHISGSSNNDFLAGGMTSAVSSSFGGDFSLFAVVNITTTGSGGTQYIFTAGTEGINNDYISLFIITSNGSVRLREDDGSLQDFAFTNLNFGGNVICLSRERETGTDINVLINGRLVTDTNSGRAPYISSTGSVILGANSVGSNPFDDAMAEFGIFNRALSIAEMKNLTSYARLKYGITT